MSCTSLSTFPDGFNMEEIVWAKRDQDGMYWPGKITFISNNFTDTLSTNNHLQYEACSYLVHFFGYDQTHWTVDVLPYRQYRDYMSKNLLIHYESYPQIKYQFLNAINQADHADINENSKSIKTNPSYNYIPTSNSFVTVCRNSTPHTTNEHSLSHYSSSSNSYQRYLSNCPYNTQLSLNDYCSCCPQPSFSSINQLSIETNINPLSQLNNEHQQLQNDIPTPQTETFSKTNSVFIITTKSYSNLSFISFLFNCFSHFSHHSIIYIDDLTTTHYQHPTTSSISYLICFDHFDTTIKHTLTSTILNNLNAHINYFFLVINSPSHHLVQHLYSTVMDQRTILILHYHSTFDNEPLLLCSGNRTTFEMIRSTLLKYLCLKVKYIESRSDEDEQFYSINDISSEYQAEHIKNEPMVDTPNQTSNSNAFIHYPNIPKDYLTVSSMLKHSKKLGQRRLLNNLAKRTLKRKFKQRVPKDGKFSVSSSDYHVQNILDT